MSKLHKILSLRERTEQDCIDKLAQSRRATADAQAQANTLASLKASYVEDTPGEAPSGEYILRNRFYAQLNDAARQQGATIARLKTEEGARRQAHVQAYRARKAIENLLENRAREDAVNAKRKARRSQFNPARAQSQQWSKLL